MKEKHNTTKDKTTKDKTTKDKTNKVKDNIVKNHQYSCKKEEDKNKNTKQIVHRELCRLKIKGRRDK